MWSLCSLCVSAGQLLWVGMSAHTQSGGATWVTKTVTTQEDVPAPWRVAQMWMEVHLSTGRTGAVPGWIWAGSGAVWCAGHFSWLGFPVSECPLQLNPVAPQAMWVRKQIFSWKEMANQHIGICVTVNVAWDSNLGVIRCPSLSQWPADLEPQGFKDKSSAS